MLGDHEFSDGAVHYTDAYSAYGPIVAGKSGIWWFTLRNRWDPGARYMPAEREVLHAARDRHQHWELTTEAMPAPLLGELREATAISCRPVLEAEDGLAGWRYRIPPRTAIAGPAPDAGGGQFWLVLAGDAAVDGGDPLPANSCIFVGPKEAAFAGASGVTRFCLSKSVQLILCPDHEQLRPLQHARDEVVAGGNFTRELFRRVGHRVVQQVVQRLFNTHSITYQGRDRLWHVQYKAMTGRLLLPAF